MLYTVYICLDKGFKERRKGVKTQRKLWFTFDFFHQVKKWQSQVATAKGMYGSKEINSRPQTLHNTL